MTRKLFLLLGGAAVVALVIGLIVSVRGTADGARRTQTNEPVIAPAERPAAPEPTPASPPTAPSATPAAPPEPIVAEPPERQPGVPVVHDHRNDPPSGTPSVLRPATVAIVHRSVQPALESCKSQAPAGANVQFSVQVGVRAEGGQLTVGDLVLHGGEPLGEPYKTCLSSALASIAAAAPEGQENGQQSIIFSAHVP
jgi:hypothetical protein